MTKYTSEKFGKVAEVYQYVQGMLPAWIMKLVDLGRIDLWPRGSSIIVVHLTGFDSVNVFPGDYIVLLENGELKAHKPMVFRRWYKEVKPDWKDSTVSVLGGLKTVMWDYDGQDSPIGLMAKDAADEIDRLEKELADLRMKKDPAVESNYLSIQLREMAHGGKILLGTQAIATLDNAAHELEVLQGANTILGGCVRDAVHEKNELKKTLRELGKE